MWKELHYRGCRREHITLSETRTVQSNGKESEACKNVSAPKQTGIWGLSQRLTWDKKTVRFLVVLHPLRQLCVHLKHMISLLTCFYPCLPARDAAQS